MAAFNEGTRKTMTQAQTVDQTPAPATVDMKDIVALCKRRGFVFPASDIYGGINGFWDYGPLGVELKNNLRDLWWKQMVVTPPIDPDTGLPVEIVGLDSAIIQNPKVWVASGHVAGFNDPMVDCKETHARYRADHLRVYIADIREHNVDKKIQEKDFESLFSSAEFFLAAEGNLEDFDSQHKKAYAESRRKGMDFSFSGGGYLVPVSDIPAVYYNKIWSPNASKPGTLTEARQFNLMLDTYPGVIRDEANKAYLRPETAQGIFINFKNVVDSSRVRVPFGIAQVGKAFRNEVTPRNFIYRSREFEQMEMEWFCHPSEAKKWREFWLAERMKFWRSIGLSSTNLIFRDHDRDELSHYAKAGEGTTDIEYRFPFTAPGFGELEGIAHRCDFDLTQHQEHSKQKLEYTDPQDPKNRYIPHVIEPAAGLTRGVLALLCEAYTPDPNRPSGVYLNFHPSVAPKKAAILPLTAKEEHVPLATKLYLMLREHYNVDLDIKQNIGKRYARQDEIGTPFCFTIDDQTAADGTITVRHRNTMKQERIAMDSALDFMRKEMALMGK
jgi:glycyl-tRNA synthetase